MPVVRKIKTTQSYQTQYRNNQIRTQYLLTESYLDTIVGNRRGQNPCLHIKNYPYTGPYGLHTDGSSYSIVNWYGAFPNATTPFGFFDTEVKRLEFLSLDWEKLPSSTKFGLIQFFAELDDAIALFTYKFVQSFSYGAFTWGLAPFASELDSFLKAIGNLSENLEAIPYEDSGVKTFGPTQHAYPGYTLEHKLTLKYRLNGYADISFHNDLSIFLDRIGFHPNLATAWDLVPLSFVLDYILPIGNMLDSLFPKGYVRSAYFKGHRSLRAVGETCLTAESGFKSISRPYSRFVTYWRSPFSDVLFVRPQDPEITLTLPSFREIFNMLYLFTSLGKLV